MIAGGGVSPWTNGVLCQSNVTFVGGDNYLLGSYSCFRTIPACNVPQDEKIRGICGKKTARSCRSAILCSHGSKNGRTSGTAGANLHTRRIPPGGTHLGSRPAYIGLLCLSCRLCARRLRIVFSFVSANVNDYYC